MKDDACEVEMPDGNEEGTALALHEENAHVTARGAKDDNQEVTADGTLEEHTNANEEIFLEANEAVSHISPNAGVPVEEDEGW